MKIKFRIYGAFRFTKKKHFFFFLLLSVKSCFTNIFVRIIMVIMVTFFFIHHFVFFFFCYLSMMTICCFGVKKMKRVVFVFYHFKLILNNQNERETKYRMSFFCSFCFFLFMSSFSIGERHNMDYKLSNSYLKNMHEINFNRSFALIKKIK